MLSPINRKYFRMAVGELKKDSDTDMSTCCPLCGDQQNRLHLFEPDNTGGIIKCFNAGCTAENGLSLLQFLEMSGSPYSSAYKRETLGQTVEKIKTEVSIQDILKKVQEKQEKQKEPKPQIELPLAKLFKKAKDVPEAVEYLNKRHIEVQDNWFFSTQKFFEFKGTHTYLLDYILIPIYNEEQKYRGFYSRSIHEKKFSIFILEDTEKIWRSQPTKKPDIICEGIFDAISSGYENSAAMLSASVSKEYRNSLSKSTIFAFDNDPTGIKKAIEYSNMGFNIFVWPEINFKDFNEMLSNGYKKSEIKKLILENTYKGIMAKTRLLMKEK